ncbi:MAG: 3-ketoacyl-ACP reductase [Sphaerochaetaceae bacterium]
MQSSTPKRELRERESKMERKGCAIITGSSRGIGLAIAKQLALDGYPVVITARGTEISNERSLQYFKDNNFEYLYVQCDVSKAQDRVRLVELSEKVFNKISILVNNAGIAPKERVDLLDMSESSFNEVMDVNLKAPMFLSQLVAKSMIKNKTEGEKATIVNITSCSSDRLSLNRGEYCMSKAGETMMSKLFALRLAEENILVHEVRPGVIKTDMTCSVKKKYDDMIDEGVFPIERWGEVEDVANAVSLLVDERMSFSTGNYIDVDGGLHLSRL